MDFHPKNPYVGDFHTQIPWKLRFWPYQKLFIGDSGFFEGIFTQIPSKSEEIFKTTRVSRKGPRVVAPMARAGCQRGFENTQRAEGDLVKIPDKKPESCAYFFLLFLTQ